MADGTVKILTDLSTEGFKNGLSKMGSIAKSGLHAVTTSVVAVGTALGGMGTYAIKVGSDFEAGMSEVAAISGASANDLSALTAKAKEMGSTTMFSATQSAEALKYMAMAGWETQAMLDGLPGVMNLAAASGEDLGAVSDILTDSMTAFGLSADKSAHFADVLAEASSSSNTNVGLMGETFKYVAPVAGALGFSVEDTATAIGLMANAGIKGSQAGTALRGMFSRLAKPTAEVQSTMDTLGVSLTNADGSMKSLGNIMDELRNGFDGLSEAQKAEMAASLAGQEGMSGLLAIVNAGDEDFDKLKESIYNADGAAQQMAATMRNNLQGAVTIAKSALEGLGISVYESLQEPLKEAVQTGTQYLGQLQRAFDNGGILGAVSALGDIFADLAVRIAEAAPKMIDTAVSFITNFLDGLSTNLPLLASAAIRIGESFISGFLEIFPRILEMAAQLVTQFATGITKALPELIPASIEIIMGLIESIYDNLPKIGQAALELVKGLAQGLLNALPLLIAALPKLIQGIVNYLITSIPALISAAIQLVDGIVAALPEIIQSLIDALPQIIEGLVSGLISCIGQMVAGAIQLVVALVSHLPEIIAGLIAAIPEIIAALVEGLLGGLEPFLNVGIRLIDSLGEGISTAWNNIVAFFTATIPALINNIGLWFSELPGRVGEWLFQTLNNVAVWASNLWAKAKEAGKNFIDGVIEFIKTLPQNVWNWLQNVLIKVTAFASDFGKKALQAGKDFFSNIINAVKEIPGKMLEIGGNIVSGIWNGISGAAGWLWNQITGFCSGIVENIKGFFGIHSPSRLMADAIGRYLPPGIAKGFQDAAPKSTKQIQGSLNEMIDNLISHDIPIDMAAQVKNDGLMAKMQAAVISSQASISGQIISRQKEPSNPADATIDYNRLTKAMGGVVLQSVVQLDGKTIAKASAPYTNREMGDTVNLEKRYA